MIRETKQIILGIVKMAEENSQLLHDKLDDKSRELSGVWEQLERERENKVAIGYVYDVSEITIAAQFVRENPSKKIQAIKMFRDSFGSDLKRAKDLIDAIMGYNTGL